MIFYFSGTGNSEGIAVKIADAMSDRAVNLVTADPACWNDDPGEILGFVFPIYAYAAPEMVLDFAKKIKAGNAFTFGVCTYSNVVGKAMEQFSHILPLKAAYGIKMPDNYPVLDHIIDTEESTLNKLRKAKVRFEQILPQLLVRREMYDVDEGSNADKNTYEGAPLFNEQMRSTKPFSVTEDLCVSCGLCRDICPARAIELRDGKPSWQRDTCCMCMGCINRCPTVAIEYGPYSRGRFRYFFRGFDTAQYFQKT